MRLGLKIARLLRAIGLSEMLPLVQGAYSFDLAAKVDQRLGDNSDPDPILADISRLPDGVVRFGNTFGSIVLVDRPLTEHPEFIHLKGRHTHDGRPYEEVHAAYDKRSCKAFVNVIGHRASVSDVLHEYGHLIDHALGSISEGPAFGAIFEKSKKEKMFGMVPLMHWYSATHAREFFAESFAEYYYSQVTRDVLKSRFPVAHEFFERLERKFR